MNPTSEEEKKRLTEELSDCTVRLLRISEQSCRLKHTKRTNYLSWPDYFMSSAYLAAMRSKDPNTQVGCVIVNEENRIVGAGYNGMPNGLSDDEMPWGKSSDSPVDTKYLYCCHAEMNAIFNRNCFELRGCTLYTTHFPCNECAKMVVQSGIRHVVFLCDKHPEDPTYVASRLILTKAGVDFRQLVPETKKIVIDFQQLAAFKV
ncbi:deoxycytidylate deaminase [Rhipicephalus sanguineus]|uniref:deoxycytidylate deaminase n=1 Tax=Rhipicephalus sanguineus TaxID=34632 RepID=UPI0020C26F03|nr:deoxycytidylate deaminase [Rhipicephalus sanguineus]